MSSDNFLRIARRRFLQTGGAGFVATAVSALLAESAVTARLQFAGAVPRIVATAKSVIFLFMEGGPGHLDLFHPKPLLNQLAGQRMPDSFGDVITPMSEKGNGRDHNPTGFTMWMAGGGVRGGQTIGTTDELGLRAVEDRLHVHDLHASMLHLLRLDNRQLTWFFQGRPERPTTNEGDFFKRLVTG